MPNNSSNNPKSAEFISQYCKLYNSAILETLLSVRKM